MVDEKLLTARLMERVCNIMSDDSVQQEIPSWRGCEIELASVADDLALYKQLMDKTQ